MASKMVGWHVVGLRDILRGASAWHIWHRLRCICIVFPAFEKRMRLEYAISMTLQCCRLLCMRLGRRVRDTY